MMNNQSKFGASADETSIQIDALAAWVRLANLIAEEPHAPAPASLTEDERDLLDRVTRRWRDLFSRPIDAPNGPPFYDDETGKIVDRQRYEFAYVVRTTLIRAANAIADSEKKGWAFDRELTINVPALPSYFQLLIFNSGRAFVNSGPFRLFLEVLAKSNLLKLKLCPVCPLLFYAGRRNQFTCSKSHARTLSMRKLRDKEKELIRRVGELARAGRDLKSIAEEIGISSASTRQYITAAKKRKHGGSSR